MSALSDTIEAFIVALLEQEDEAQLKRNQLAADFCCAPSQINYVLQTRFSSQRGYIVESRRGGGGYIRILRMREDDGKQGLYDLCTHPPEQLTQEQAIAWAGRAVQVGMLAQDQASLMLAAMSEQALRDLPQPQRSQVRARIFHSMLTNLIQQEGRP